MDTTFIILSLITVVGAVWAVTLRNLIHGVLSLVLFFFGIAGFFFYLNADFVGWVQILVYVGAVAILAVFAIMLTRHLTAGDEPGFLSLRWLTGAAIAAAVGAVLWTAIKNNPAMSQAAPAGVASRVADIGNKMMTDWVVPFEVVSLLLTAAMIGAIVIALEQITHRK
jgi:NADH:ubiquinone oxidoreductase subunit 6 (subunit J)